MSADLYALMRANQLERERLLAELERRGEDPDDMQDDDSTFFWNRRRKRCRRSE